MGGVAGLHVRPSSPASGIPKLFFFSHLPVRIRKVWQKRKCSVKNGFLTISHGTVSIPPPPRSLPQGQAQLREGRRVKTRPAEGGAAGPFCARHACAPFTRLRPGKRVIFWYPAESGVTDEPGGLCSERQTDRQADSKAPPSHLCLQKLNMALGKISPFPLREKHLRGQDSGSQKPQRTDFSNFIMEISHPAPKPNRALRPSSL